MRASKTLILAALVLSMGAVQASSTRQANLRISLTIVDRCDVRNTTARPSVDCSVGVPWAVAPAAAQSPSLQVAGRVEALQLPVPPSGPGDGANLTTIVF